MSSAGAKACEAHGLAEKGPAETDGKARSLSEAVSVRRSVTRGRRNRRKRRPDAAKTYSPKA
jgi:hypothetical protein